MYAELLARSCFSFLRGASHPEELVERAKELDLGAVALCDRDGLYGSVRALVRAREGGQRVIVGAELGLATAETPMRRGSWSRSSGSAALDREPPVVALLVENALGYRNLCRLLTRAHADLPKGESALELEALAEHAEGLFAVAPAPFRPDAPDAPTPALLALLRDTFAERAL